MGSWRGLSEGIYPFKQFKYMPVPKVEKAPEFENKNLKILDAVKKYYYDIYSAKALEEICHREKPYINAREGYEEGESCNIVIDKKIYLLIIKMFLKDII